MPSRPQNLLVLKKRTDEPTPPMSGILDELERAVAETVGARPAEVKSVVHHEVPEVYAPMPHPIDAWAKTARHRIVAPQPVERFDWRGILSLTPWLLGAGAVVAGLLYVSVHGFQVKGEVVQQGNAAIQNLMSAHDDLKRLDVLAAQQDFQQASDKFASIQQQLGAVGTGLLQIISALPGGTGARNAKDVLAAGEHITGAGIAISQALGALGSTASILQIGSAGSLAATNALAPLATALKRGTDDLGQAQTLLADVDAAALPVETQQQFVTFRDQLPALLSVLGDSQKMLSFVQQVTGSDRPRRYLLLFENSSELRPAGGFPGSYGLLTFENGRVKDFRADDIYNPDGQIKQLIVPPKQLQSITPGWGMRDAGWFVDFPTSAQKVMSFWQKGGGSAVDGVLAVNDALLADILAATGPISLPQYGLTLDSQNVVAQLQQEVEVDKLSGKPKQVIMDLAPQMLDRLASVPSDQWSKLLTTFQSALARRDIMMYFADPSLQDVVASRGWSGAVRDTPGDYLSVNVANIKGAKEDAVTDTALKLESWIEGGTMVHRLTITRQNNGGSSQYAFYNKPNHSWIRVLVPAGSVLRGVTGNEQVTDQAMTDYTTQKAIIDPDLQNLEATYQSDHGITRFQESGRTGFGFWSSVNPGKTSRVQIEYAIPAGANFADYQLLVQRQPGLRVSNFEFTLQKTGGVRIGPSSKDLVEWPDSWRYDDPLDKDLELEIPVKS